MGGQSPVDNPNYHEFGPSLEETHLAMLAAGGNPYSPNANQDALNMLYGVHQQRMADDDRYQDQLAQDNQTRQQIARTAAQQAFMTGVFGLAGKGQPVTPYLQYGYQNGMLGDNPAAGDTSMFGQSDALINANELSKIIQQTGAGANTAAEGGHKINVGPLNNSLLPVTHDPNFFGDTPTRVDADLLKAQKEAQPKETISQTDAATGVVKNSMTGPPGMSLEEARRDPRAFYSKYPDVWNGYAAQGLVNPIQTYTANGAAAPATAPAAGSAHAGNVGADTNVTPEMVKPYNQLVIKPALAAGIHIIGGSQRQNDGSLVWDANQGGVPIKIRLFKSGGRWQAQREGYTPGAFNGSAQYGGPR